VSDTSELLLELRLTRTILERLECSFARQEAKLDQLLRMTTTTNTGARTFELSTPVPTSQPAASLSQSVEFAPDIFERTAMLDLERLLDEPDLTGDLKLTFKLISFVWSERIITTTTGLPIKLVRFKKGKKD